MGEAIRQGRIVVELVHGSKAVLAQKLKIIHRSIIKNKRLFIGADGWVQGVGPTNADQMRGDAACSMAESAEQVVVLTESEKFGRRGAIPMRLSRKRMSLITDESIPSK